mgnify:CR=1 FL=1|jgi:hypothetical protein
MASKPPTPKTPDPATIATSPGEQAKKRQELHNRRVGGFYSKFKNIRPTGPATGGDNQPLG